MLELFSLEEMEKVMEKDKFMMEADMKWYREK